ncbi:hypothetical protein AAVH_25694 [Aphelenchoides avenae]|nr:hypothetical protein AAVH_25694 [Aphelenchus avenae]
MDDVEEKSVYAFKNENTGTEITAVVARYICDSQTSLACNFIFNPSENLDIGDFSQKHIKSIGVGCNERLNAFD